MAYYHIVSYVMAQLWLLVFWKCVFRRRKGPNDRPMVLLVVQLQPPTTNSWYLWSGARSAGDLTGVPHWSGWSAERRYSRIGTASQSITQRVIAAAYTTHTASIGWTAKCHAEKNIQYLFTTTNVHNHFILQSSSLTSHQNMVVSCSTLDWWRR